MTQEQDKPKKQASQIIIGELKNSVVRNNHFYTDNEDAKNTDVVSYDKIENSIVENNQVFPLDEFKETKGDNEQDDTYIKSKE